MRKKHRIFLHLMEAFLLAVVLILSLLVSNHANVEDSEIYAAYKNEIQQADISVLLKAKELAIAYNEAITPGNANEAYYEAALLEASVDYKHQLDITNTGIMGYVEIPKLHVKLPIYHGTSSDSLGQGVGHLIGSSLPVGGESTHTILIGRRETSTQKIFADLEKLSIDDVFLLHVLNETLAYQVIEINAEAAHNIILPDISLGSDYCTLVTTASSADISHWLLIRGERISYEDAKKILEQ